MLRSAERAPPATPHAAPRVRARAAHERGKSRAQGQSSPQPPGPAHSRHAKPWPQTVAPVGDGEGNHHCEAAAAQQWARSPRPLRSWRSPGRRQVTVHSKCPRWCGAIAQSAGCQRPHLSLLNGHSQQRLACVAAGATTAPGSGEGPHLLRDSLACTSELKVLLLVRVSQPSALEGAVC